MVTPRGIAGGLVLVAAVGLGIGIGKAVYKCDTTTEYPATIYGKIKNVNIKDRNEVGGRGRYIEAVVHDKATNKEYKVRFKYGNEIPDSASERDLDLLQRREIRLTQGDETALWAEVNISKGKAYRNEDYLSKNLNPAASTVAEDGVLEIEERKLDKEGRFRFHRFWTDVAHEINKPETPLLGDAFIPYGDPHPTYSRTPEGIAVQQSLGNLSAESECIPNRVMQAFNEYASNVEVKTAKETADKIGSGVQAANSRMHSNVRRQLSEGRRELIEESKGIVEKTEESKGIVEKIRTYFGI